MHAVQTDWVDMAAVAAGHARARPGPSQQRQLRNALGCFPTGVTVVTTCDEQGRLYGVTANSFSSVSLDPPIVLWSQKIAAPSHPVFKRAAYFAINVLESGQERLSAQFSRPASDKFDGVDYDLTEEGIPLLKGAAAQFVCRNDSQCHGGDHIVFFGNVIRFGYSPTACPLIYARGGCLPRPDREALASK